MWQVLAMAGITAAAAGTVLINQRRKYRRMLCKAKAKKLAELSAAGFVFSKEYDMDGVALLVDKPNKQWAMLDYSAPAEAKPRPFSAIGDVRIICRQKIHSGLRSPIGVGAVRRSANGTNLVKTVTDAVRGVEIGLTGEDAGQVLYVNTLDADYSAERVQAIFESLQEQARAGEPLEE